ncbi:MAG: hypothetical protein K2N38_02440 [Oscillospiraceae bacterium]|nr:hypothetical protein [Oscillospiraceae bacterium]
MINAEITNYVDFVRQTVAPHSKVKPERVYDGNPRVVTYNIPAIKMSEEIDLSTSAHEDGSAPSRWTSDAIYTNDINAPMGCRVNRSAFDRVREQLKAEGINADKRTPTHEITDEQMDWLEARYDFDYLSVCGYQHTDFGNFMLDLAYMNVFSLEEIEDMCGLMPFEPDGDCFVFAYCVSGGYYMGDNGEMIDEEQVQTEYITRYIKAKHPRLTEAEYNEMIKQFSSQLHERMMIFKSIFEQLSNRMTFIPGSGFPQIEDASEKLKEDFGVRVNG